MRIHSVSYFAINPGYSINISNSTKTKLEISINIIVIIFFVWLFLFIKLNLTNENINNPFLFLEDEELIKKESVLNSKYSMENLYKNNNNKSLRKLTTFFQGKYSKEDFIKKKQLKNIIDKLTNTKYIGKWFTKKNETKKLMIGDSIEGFTKIKFKRAIEISNREDALAILVNNYEDKYINHWLQHTSFILNKNLNLTSDKENNLLYFNGKWETDVDYGELFITKISRRSPCSSNLQITFPLKNVKIITNISNGESFTETIDTIDNTNFSLYFNSSCGFNMSMELHLDDLKRLKETNIELNKYIISLSIILLLEMMSVFLMNKDLKNNNEAIKCISLFTIIQNINWHFYCCMTHITWSITNFNYFYHFNIISLLYIFIIIGFDFGFIFSYWKIKKDHVTNREFINLKIIFYITFYLFFFFSFYIISDILIYYPLIIISGIIMWTPQIIYNTIHYNRYIYPFFYIITSSIERLFFGFYFRGYDKNFYKIKGNKLFIYIIIIYYIINYIILLLQLIKGPRFFMKKKYIRQDFDFYKTKEELMESSNDIENVECVICLQPIFCDEISDSNVKEKEDNSTTDSNTSRNGIELSINELNKGKQNMEINILKNKKFKKKNNVNKPKKKCCNNIYYNLKEIIDILFYKGFYKFYRISKNPHNKKYMKTPCNHAFHSICLEKWFIRKKECPNCRNNLSDKIT